MRCGSLFPFQSVIWRANEMSCDNIVWTSINLNLRYCYVMLRLDVNLNAKINYITVLYKTLIHYLEITSWEWSDYNSLKFYTIWFICYYVSSVKSPFCVHKMNHSLIRTLSFAAFCSKPTVCIWPMYNNNNN